MKIFKLVLISILLVITVPALGQINYRIQFDTTLIPRWNYDPPWKYGAEFVIEDELKPLKSSKVNFTLNSFIDDEKDWTIRLAYLESNVEVSGDTLFYWPGPHKFGDIYSGSFYVEPMRSGGGVVALAGSYSPDVAMDMEAGIVWCFDEDGVLKFLDQIGSDHKACFKSIVYFFSQDSVYFEQHRISDEILVYDLSITPVPQVGDTSEMRLTFTSFYDIPNGCDLRIDASCFDLIAIPDTFNYAVAANNKFDMIIKFVPMAINGGHQISLNFFNCSHSTDRRINRQTISFYFLFKDNGALRYITNSTTLFDIDKEKKPTTFRDENYKQDQKSIFLRAIY